MLRLEDILTAYTTAQSDKSKDKVAKLSYVVRKKSFKFYGPRVVVVIIYIIFTNRTILP